MTSKSQNSVNQAHALAARVASGVGWVYASYAAGKLLVFLTTIILARLLDVEDFGLVGYALILVNYLDVVKDLGISSAIIAHPQGIASERVRSTAFALTVLAGLFMTLAALLLAPLAASFFGEPSAIGLTQVLGLTLLLSGLGRTHDALLQKDLNFRRKLVPDLAHSLVKGGASISLALLGFGPWSIVWGQVVGTAAGTVASWVVYPWRPKLVLDREVARDLLGFGSQLIGVNLIAALVTSSDYLVVGRLLGVEALGQYTLAFRLPELLLLNLCWVLSRVLFPLFAQMSSNLEDLRRSYLATARFVASVVLPVGLGLSVTAPSLVAALYGEKWAPVAPILQLLALAVTLHALFFHAGDVFKALGRGGILLLNRAQMGVVLLATMLISVHWQGPQGVALAWILAELLYAWLNLRRLHRIIGTRPWEVLSQTRIPLLGGFFLLVSAESASRVHPERGWSQLLLQVLVGAAAYITVVAALDRPLVKDIRSTLSALREGVGA